MRVFLQMAEGLDSGDIIMTDRLTLDKKETAGSLTEKLANMAGPLLLKALEAIEAGTATKTSQEEDKATYVTNGIVHARKLVQKGLNAYLVGGKVKSATEATVGAEAIANLKNFNFSKAFLGANGIDINAGFTTPEIEEAKLKEAAVNTSYMTFILADRTKFRRVFSVTFSQLKKCCIITDSLPDSSYSKETVIKEVMK